MATATANDIIQDSMVEAKIISPGESVPSSRMNFVFNRLNGLLESWSLEKLMVYATVVESFTLTSGQAEYTYGSGGDFDAERPIRINGVVQVDGQPVEIKDLRTFQRLPDESGGFPSIVSYNPEFPLFRVYFWPTPDSGYLVTIPSWKQLTEFTDRTTEVSLPKGYWRAIVLNLAVEISNSFGKKVSGELMATATQSKGNIKKSNVTPIGVRTSDFASSIGG